MNHHEQDFRFEGIDKRKHRALEEARRRAGWRMWAAVVAAVVLPVAVVLLVKGMM